MWGKSDERSPIVEWPVSPPSSVLVALHGGAGTAQKTAPEWRSCVSTGSLLIVPESPFWATSDEETGHDWPSIDASALLVTDALRAAPLPSEGELAAVVGGFSQGGRVAAQLAISAAPFRWRGAVLFGPAPMHPYGIETIPP
jgi:pimeloyl-ACP methyl ester carboxylesterase